MHALVALGLLAALPASGLGSAHAQTLNTPNILLHQAVGDLVRRNAQNDLVRQAAYALSSESADVDGDGVLEPPAMLTGSGGPTGGGRIPAASLAAKTDGFGGTFGYCAFDGGTVTGSANRINGSTSLNAAILAVVSPGLDGSFQSTCANILSTGAGSGDDVVVVVTAGQAAQGVNSSLYWGTPVADTTALNALAAASLREGEVRLVRASNQLMRWNSATLTWVGVSASDWVRNGNNLYYNTGNVGIGTSTPAALLDVTGSSQANVRLNGPNGAWVDIKRYGANSYYRFETGAGSNDDLRLLIDGNWSAPILTAKPNGQIGIGTATPTEKLHVEAGSIYVNGEGTGVIVDASGNKRVGLMKYAGHEGVISRIAGQDFGITRVGTGNIFDLTGLTYDLYVGATGNVGIGTVTPLTPLHVNSPVGDAGLYIGATGKSTRIAMHIAGGDYGYLDMGGSGSGWTVLRSGGYTSQIGGALGLGMTPSARLDIMQPSTGWLDGIRMSVVGGSNSYTILNDGGGSFLSLAANQDYTKSLILRGDTGNVGIGTITPAYKLDVAGTFGATGSATIGGNLSVAGDATIGQQRLINLTRTVPANVGEAVDLGTFTVTHTGAVLEFDVVVSDGGFSVAKHYQVPVLHYLTNGGWVEVAALSSSGAYNGNDFALDANIGSWTATFRLRRTSGNTAGSFRVVARHAGRTDISFTPSTTVTAPAAPSTLMPSAVLTQVGGMVGVGTTAPQAALDVGGRVWVGLEGPAYGVRIKTSWPGYNGGWARGYYIANESNSANYMALGSYGTTSNGVNTLAYSWLGPEWNNPYMTFLPNGRIGVGTTTPVDALDLGWGTSGRSIVWGGPGGAAHYATIGTSYSSAALNMLAGLRLNKATDAYEYAYTGNMAVAGQRMEPTTGEIRWFTAPVASRTAGAAFDINTATRMVIKPTGNVLIGTTTDNGVDLLQVAGTIGAAGLNTPNQGKVQPLSLRGTGLNNSAPNHIILGSTVLASNSSRGLTLVVLNKSDHSVASTGVYDTFGNAAASDALAVALNAISNQQLGLLVSFDAWTSNVSANLKAAALQKGLFKLAALTGYSAQYRAPYAAIFDGASSAAVGTARANECVISLNAVAPYCDMRGWLSNGGFSIAGDTLPNALVTPEGASAAVFVDASGFVGVGTTSPLERIHTADGRIRVGVGPDSGVLEGGVGYGSKLRLNYSDGVANVLLTGNNDSYLNVNYGRVGIGTTTPTRKLDLIGDLRIVGSDATGMPNGWQRGITFGNSGHAAMMLESNQLLFGLHGDNSFYWNRAGTYYMALSTNTGNLGVGVVSPLERLHVTDGRIRVGSGADSGVLEGGSGYGSKLRLNYADGVANVLLTGNGDSYLNANWGRVGIGTAAPTEKLHVVGDTRLDTGYKLRFGGVMENSDDIYFVRSNPGANVSELLLNLGDDALNGAGDRFVVRGLSSNFLVVDSNQGVLMPSGNVGIGTTDTTNFKLNLAGSVGPVVDNTHDLGSASLRWRNIYAGGALSAQTISAPSIYADRKQFSETSAGRWVRIAQSPVSGVNNNAVFSIDWARGGIHGHARVAVGANFNWAGGFGMNLLSSSMYNVQGVSKLRLVHASTYDVMYLEIYTVYGDPGGPNTISITKETGNNGASDWQLITPQTGAVPGGYATRELTLSNAFAVNDDSRPFVVTRAGYVGIGTVNPGSALEVVSTDTTNSAWNYPLRVRNGLSGGGQLTVTGFNNTATHAVAGDTMLSTESGSLLLSPNLAGRDLKFIGGSWLNPISMIIKDGGNVGIGTATPQDRLHIAGGHLRLENNQALRWFANTDGANIRFESVGDGAGQSKLILETVDNGDEQIVFRQSGADRVIIGPLGQMEIITQADNILRLRQNQPGNVWNYIEWYNDTQRQWYTGTDPSGNWTIGRDAGMTGHVVITGGASLGVGAATPLQALHVVGSALLSDRLAVGNDANSISNSYMAAGSMVLGNIGQNYGGATAGWTGSMAGLLMQAASNTEIAVHDSGQRVASLMYYEGDAVNRISIGRNTGWGAISQIALNGNVGIGTTAPGQALDVRGHITLPNNGSMIYMPEIGANTSVSGIAAYSTGMSDGVPYYGAWVREAGAWTHPYPDYVLNNHTGVRIAAHSGYGGVSIYEELNAAGTTWSSSGQEIARFRTDPYGGTYFNTNVGIGTASPAAKLEVNGLVKAGGNYLNVLNYAFNGTPSFGIHVKTNLPWCDGCQMPTLVIEGFNYGSAQAIGLTLSWYIYAGVPYNATVSSHGAWTPPISMYNNGGKVAFFINDRGYYTRFTVRAYAQGMSEVGSWFAGWTTEDAPVLSSAVAVNYKNNFMGVVGIGTMSPSQTLHVVGNGLFSGTVTAGGFVSTSDQRIKQVVDNLQSRGSVLAKLAMIDPVLFRFVPGYEPASNSIAGVEQLGVLAQQIAQVFPWLVHAMDDPTCAKNSACQHDGLLGVNYAGLSTVAIAAVKEQQQILQSHAKVINQFEQRQAGWAFKGTFTADRLEAQNAQLVQLQADQAKIRDLEAQKIRAQQVSSERVQSGETDVFVPFGVMVNLFTAPPGTQFVVNAMGDDGSHVSASVMHTSAGLKVVPLSAQGLEVLAQGTTVGIAGPNRKVSASWLRTK